MKKKKIYSIFFLPKQKELCFLFSDELTCHYFCFFFFFKGGIDTNASAKKFLRKFRNDGRKEIKRKSQNLFLYFENHDDEDG